VIINEAMAKAIGEKEALGTMLQIHDDRKTQVIGVVKNYHFASLREQIEPMCLNIEPSVNASYVLIRVKPGDLNAGLATVRKAWKKIAPKLEFQGTYLSENMERQYRNERMMSKILLFAAGLTIALAAMGLFAVAVLVIAQRTKEIGVRKVLGASVTNVVGLLAKDFLKLVVIGVVIASLPAWYLMSAWLRDYAYHISFPWMMLVLAGVTAVGVAFLTVSYQSLRAALRNPVEAIRNG
jgi:putative ABC transport system permease protein